MLPILSTGVEIPNAVHHALEDERLVFFCGAGISMYTGLPNFRGLTVELFRKCHIELAEIPERRADFCDSFRFVPGKSWEIAFWERKYDRALALLEDHLPKGAMRRLLCEILRAPPPEKEKDCSLHRDLLDLSALRGGGHRLVTTNFDDRFQLGARADLDPSSPRPQQGHDLSRAWEAPRIATPRAETWRSLTFLHGRITEGVSGALDDLIITSADFGRAYLQDGWAARFVVELFREFTVLFVGYGINDPVMTYLVDAIAMDRASGRPFRQPYAIAGIDEDEDRETTLAQWRSKHVEPVLYSAADGHIALRKTIEDWAALHRGGFEARLNTATEILTSKYVQVGKEDRPRIENLVWSLSDKDGAVARALADADRSREADKRKNLAWLGALLAWGDEALEARAKRMRKNEGDSARSRDSTRLGAFSVDGYWVGDPLSPPARTDELGSHIRLTPLFERRSPSVDHPVARHLTRWIAGRLDEPELARLVAERGGRIGKPLRDSIAAELSGQRDPLPGDLSTFWRIVLFAYDQRASGRPETELGLLLARTPGVSGLDADSRKRLLDAFAPRVSISTAMWTPEDIQKHAQQDGETALSWEEAASRLPALASIELADYSESNYLSQSIDKIRKPEHQALLSDLAPDLGECLVGVLRIAHWIDDQGPLSYHRIQMPSLHDTERDHFGRLNWANLVELCRDALTTLTEQSQSAGKHLLERWVDYAREPWGELFGRLVLHACASNRTEPEIGVALLLENGGGLLWASEFESELAPLLQSLPDRLRPEMLSDLVQVVRAGPPRSKGMEDD